MYENISACITNNSAIVKLNIVNEKSIITKPIAQNCKLAFAFPNLLGGIIIPSFPARPRRPIIINSRAMSSTVIQILTLPTIENPANTKVTKILSAIVSKKAPNLVLTFHFLAR